MKLYNTLSRRLEEFTPLHDNEARVYSCGPTVYDHIHIGNLSAFIYADTLRRVLTASGYQVQHVMNFTDVDDKTIRRSREQYPDLEAREALAKLTTHYGDIFLADMQKAGNDTARYTFVHATDAPVINGMQQLVRDLYAAGFAYPADDGVYFSIDAYRRSGKTYGQLTDITASDTSQERIQNDEYDKESAHDFALWKKQKPGEPAWSFEIEGHDMTGRPGWHLECSVMSSANLGQPFDIHTGGIDLIFPHHENEIAQSTAGKDDPRYARFFVHNEHILVDGKKMSKSLNNFYTLQDIIDKGYDPLAFRLLVLQSHYRSQVHFSWENLEAAQNRLGRFRNLAVRRFQGPALQGGSANPTTVLTQKFKVLPALQDDLDTPSALAAVEAYIDSIEQQNTADEKHLIDLFVEQLDNVFGLNLGSVVDISSEQKQLIAQREQARAAKDWAESDRLRDYLSEQGIGLRDTPTGAVWYWL